MAAEDERVGAKTYGFTGKEEDVEVGLIYFGKRFYAGPALQRWVSADPLEVHLLTSGDPNLYAYGKGMALKVVDALGLSACGGNCNSIAGQSFDAGDMRQPQTEDEFLGQLAQLGSDHVYGVDPSTGQVGPGASSHQLCDSIAQSCHFQDAPPRSRPRRIPAERGTVAQDRASSDRTGKTGVERFRLEQIEIESRLTDERVEQSGPLGTSVLTVHRNIEGMPGPRGVDTFTGPGRFSRAQADHERRARKLHESVLQSQLPGEVARRLRTGEKVVSLRKVRQRTTPVEFGGKQDSQISPPIEWGDYVPVTQSSEYYRSTTLSVHILVIRQQEEPEQ
jgi:RHS repeat-associated protein